jgi:hypothetical protein
LLYSRIPTDASVVHLFRILWLFDRNIGACIAR